LNEEREELDPDSPAPDFFRAAWLFYLVLAVSGVIWLGFTRGDIHLAAFFSLETWPRDLAFGALAATTLIVLWALGRRFVPAMRELEATIRQAIGPIDHSESLVLAIVSGFSEELFFRGAMLGSWGPWISTLLFGLVHSGPGVASRYWIAFALIAGSGFAWLTLETGNLAAAMLAHILVNAIHLWRLTSQRIAMEATES